MTLVATAPNTDGQAARIEELAEVVEEAAAEIKRLIQQAREQGNIYASD